MELQEIIQDTQTSRPFSCNWDSCEKNFSRKSDLQRHYRIHTNERPFACIVKGCYRSFIQKSALKVHARTHSGEKPHQCPRTDCGRRFSDSSSLARHRRIHTGKRPYECGHDGCSKRFCRKSTMTRHRRRSHPLEVPSADYFSHPSSESPGWDQATLPNYSSSPSRENTERLQHAHFGQTCTMQCLRLGACDAAQAQDAPGSTQYNLSINCQCCIITPAPSDFPAPDAANGSLLAPTLQAPISQKPESEHLMVGGEYACQMTRSEPLHSWYIEPSFYHSLSSEQCYLEALDTSSAFFNDRSPHSVGIMLRELC